MKIFLLYLGKTEEPYLLEGTDKYINRIKKYINVEEVIIPALKKGKLSIEEQKKLEGELILKKTGVASRLYLLDEKGTQFNSVGFADFLQKQMNDGSKNIFFIIGGPYGFSEEVYKRANGLISLSKLTFSHQMVRLFLAEQLYRAFTILKNEPYHHS